MRRRNLLGAVAAAAAAASGCSGNGESTDPPPGGTFLLRNVRVFDGERVLDADSVRVEEGLIAAVGSGLPAPTGVPTHDGGGGTVLPGLVDAHVHLIHDNSLSHALRFGTTSALEMFGAPGRIAELRDAREQMAPTDHADAWSAGILATAPGGHGTQYGGDIPTLGPDGDPDAFVADRHDEGSDYLKIVIDDFSVYGNDTVPTLPGTQVRALVEAAHRRDLLAVVHVAEVADAVTATEAGADALMHMPVDGPFDDAQLDVLRSAGIPVVATLSIYSTMACDRHAEVLRDDPRVAPLLAENQLADLRRTYGYCLPEVLEHARANTNALREAGVPVLAGTDAGNPGTAIGASMFAELGLLVEAGLTPAEALIAATAAPADHFGLGDRGRIAPELRADLVLVEGDPTREIDAVHDTVMVWKNGHPVDRQPR